MKTLVAEALELAPAERPEFIAARTGTDAALRFEVDSLLRAADGTTGVLSPSLDVWVGLSEAARAPLDGQRIGRYRLDRLIAEGSTAAVYEATQDAPHRRVAVKVLRDALPLVDASRRFDQEAAALGRLDHPHLARIFESGRHRTADGRVLPFIAMEYVDGPPVTRYVNENRLSRDDVLQLGIKIASAVHAAHQQGIIHRDLKPANVLVDAHGEPRVLDFGIARLLDNDARTWHTHTGLLIGTPAYMSPEQAAGKLDQVDVRTDVWACAALVYEMLVGRPPIETRDLPVVEAIRRVEREEPVPLGRNDATLRGDLELILMTALSRDKNRRYASAQAFADDLARYLRHEPISARPPSTVYILSRFARRHRAGLAVAGLFMLTLAAGAVLLTRAYFTASDERDRAKTVSDVLRSLVQAGDPNYGNRDARLSDVLRNVESRIEQTVRGRPDVEADLRASLGEMHFALGEYDESQAMLTRAVTLYGSIGAADSTEGLSARLRLATTLRWQSHPAEARQLARDALESARRSLGDDHALTLTAMEVLAGCDHDEQNLEAAESGYRAAAVATSKSLGEDHVQTRIAMSNLANVLSDRGKYEEAATWHQRVVEALRRTGASRTLEGITARHNHATTIGDLGRLADAIRDLEAIAADAQTALGPAHDMTLRILATLSEMLRRAGETDRALGLSREIVDRRVASLGWAHEVTQSDLIALTAALLRADRRAEALELGQRAVTEAERAGDRDSIPFHRLQLNVAAALCGLGRFDEARATYRGSLDVLRRQLGPDHRYTLIGANNFGLCCIDAGDADMAIALLEPLLAEVLRQAQVTMEPVVRRNLGNAYRIAGRNDDAERELLQAWNQSTQRGEKENAARCAAGLAALYRDIDPAKSAEWQIRANGAAPDNSR